MPVLLLGAPVAAVLAWLALRGGRRRSRGTRAEDVAGVNGTLEPGRTGRLDADAGDEDEEPFKRRELRERPQASGGELGQYGPPTQDAAPSAGGSTTPGPTQTFVSEGGGSGGSGGSVFGLPSAPLPAGTPYAGGYASGQPGFQFIPLDAPPMQLFPTAPAPTTSGHVEV